MSVEMLGNMPNHRAASPALIHPLIVRMAHWTNAVAMIVMISSGWQIYNASPIFPFRFPEALTLGGWLGGALQWHFAAMWLIVINGGIYLVYGFASGRFALKFLPISLQGILQDVSAALSGKLAHDFATHPEHRAVYLQLVGPAVSGELPRLLGQLEHGAGDRDHQSHEQPWFWQDLQFYAA